MPIEQRRIVIDGVTPSVDAGRFAAKAALGDAVKVGAHIFKDGHDKLRACVLWRPVVRTEPLAKTWGEPPVPSDYPGWREAPLVEDVNDCWEAAITCDRIGDWVFTICAWTDRFGSFIKELFDKAEAGDNVERELLEGTRLVEETLALVPRGHADAAEIAALLQKISAAEDMAACVKAMLDHRLVDLMAQRDARPDATMHDTEMPLWVDRQRAKFGSWYEIFVRSQGTDPSRSATFKEAEQRLPYIASLGFDVLYLAPIHPIGRRFRKGPNNSEVPLPDSPGSCWAVGSDAGGHTAIHPDLGTLADFDHFLATAQNLGIEIALDFAIQCSPDHPWVKEHPEWFRHRPDGSIKYAENPPKKYQDIYPIDFDTADRDGLYEELLRVVLFWIDRGVKIFRVDNPHTKPTGFWEWLILRIHRQHPDVLFLAEAFTKPKRMARLAKAGFTQSYTYFTWRNTRHELESYAKELFCTDVRHYFRPNFFANTPDILHAYLQHGGRPAFVIRLVLAATLSPTYGIYNGFELCENRAVAPGSEEYLDSEKYQYKAWDWDRPGNIKDIVTRVNAIRKNNPALQSGDNITLLESSSPEIIAYAKYCPADKNTILVVVNVDPHHVHDGTVGVPKAIHGGDEHSAFAVTDLLTDNQYTWHGYWNYVRLDPHTNPAHVFKIGG
jgi:starch synthase (maltosyl-transferring)